MTNMLRHTRVYMQRKRNVLESNYNSYSDQHLLIGILLFFVLLLGVLVAAIGYILVQEVYYTLPSLSNVNLDSLSVFCDDLSLSPGEDFDTFVTEKSQLKVSVDANLKYICSGSNFTSLLQKVVEKQTRLRQSKGLDNRAYLSCGNTSLQRRSGDLTISLSGILHNPSYKDHSEPVTLHWDKQVKHSYIHPLIKYNNGEIDIPEGNTYFVYVSVHINTTAEDKVENDDRNRRFTLRLSRKVNDYEQTLLMNTKLFSGNHRDVKSSLRIAGVLQLNRGDKIVAKVSNANQLIVKSAGNTFGFYPL